MGERNLESDRVNPSSDEFGVLREEVARALWPLLGGDSYQFEPDLAESDANYLLAVVFSDPVRLLRVLAAQPCRVCNDPDGVVLHPEHPEHMLAICDACHGSGRFDVVGALVTTGELEEIRVSNSDGAGGQSIGKDGKLTSWHRPSTTRVVGFRRRSSKET